MHVVDDQPDPVPQRAQVRQQPLDDRPPVQIRRRGQGPDERRTGRRGPQRVGHRGPEPPRIVILLLHRHLGGMLREGRASIHDRSRTDLPLPAGPDTSVTRPARLSRSNSSRRTTTPPLTTHSGSRADFSLMPVTLMHGPSGTVLVLPAANVMTTPRCVIAGYPSGAYQLASRRGVAAVRCRKARSWLKTSTVVQRPVSRWGHPMATTIPYAPIGIIVTSMYRPLLAGGSGHCWLAVTGRYTLAGVRTGVSLVILMGWPGPGRLASPVGSHVARGASGPVRINDRLR